MSYQKVLAVMLLLLACVPLVFSAEPFLVDKPFPVFSLTYAAANSPVFISSINLTDQYNQEYALTQTAKYPADSPWQYNYTPTHYLPNGLYTLVVEAISSSNDDTNQRTDTFSLAIDNDQMDILVTQPAFPLFENAKDQDFAVGDASSFNINLTSQGDAICRIKGDTGQINNLSDEWNSAPTVFNTGDETEVTTHNLIAQSTTPPNNTLLQVSPLDYTNLFTHAFLVVCQQTLNEEPVYSVRKLHVGYDTTPPQFSISFNPSTIEDYADITTTMNITTQEDLVVCSYNVSLFSEDTEQDVLFKRKPATLTSLSDFFTTTQANISFNFQKSFYTFGKPYEYIVAVNCTNPAGLSAQVERPFTIQLTSNLRINIEERYFSTSSPTLSFHTNLPATCYHTTDGSLMNLTTTDNRTHTISKTFEEGTNPFTLTCRALSSGATEKKTFTIVVDTTKPLAPSIGSGAALCTQRMQLLLEAPDPEDTVQYNISLYNSSSTTTETMVLAPELTSFTDDDLLFKATRSFKPKLNKTYTWKVQAIDKAGNKGSFTTFQMTRVTPDAVICDVTPPKVAVDVDKTTTGYKVSILCEDEESGCTDSYQLDQIAPNQTCNYSEGLAVDYADNPVQVTSDKQLCFVIQDLAGNNKTGKTTLSIDEQQRIEQLCANGYEDVGEEGVDCGGICGSDNPCPQKEPSTYESETNQTDNKTSLDEGTCGSDFDCEYNYICSNGECVYSPQETNSSLALLFIILGVFFIIGGIGYIVYSEIKRGRYTAHQSTLHRQTTQEQEALARQRLAEEQKYLQKLKEKRKAGEEKRAELSKEKKEERGKLLEAFGDEDDDITQDSKTTPFTPEKTAPEKTAPDKQDTDTTDEFIPLEKLDATANTEEDDTLITKENTNKKDVFKDLEKITKKNKTKDSDESAN